MPNFFLHPSMFSQWSPIARKIIPWCFRDIAQTSPASPQHYLISLSFLQHPPIIRFLFFFLHPLPSSHHPLNNPGYLSCGFFFKNFCLLCNIIDFSSWGSHIYSKWRLYSMGNSTITWRWTKVKLFKGLISPSYTSPTYNLFPPFPSSSL
jgi:hypothetical protein